MMAVLQGLTTMVLTADDVEAAAAWYADVLGAEHYFRRPEEGTAQYVEFRLGPDEDEFGIMDRQFSPGAGGQGTSVTYWHVADIEATLASLLERGSTVQAPVMERGEGFFTASIVDPFGNVLGLMQSPHWAARH